MKRIIISLVVLMMVILAGCSKDVVEPNEPQPDMPDQPDTPGEPDVPPVEPEVNPPAEEDLDLVGEDEVQIGEMI